MKNKDGLEAGQEVDFSTLMRIKAKQRGQNNDTASAGKAKVHASDKPEPKNTPATAGKKKA